jgi:hypothetical protein
MALKFGPGFALGKLTVDGGPIDIALFGPDLYFVS